MASEGKKVPFLSEEDKDFPNLWREGEFHKSSGVAKYRKRRRRRSSLCL